jgi:hypothetical protein
MYLLVFIATTTTTPVVSAYWSLNNNTKDMYNNYNGVAMNGSTYVTGYIGLSGKALSFTANLSQYVTVASPFFNLSYRSFTVEMWFYPTTLPSVDSGLFGQFQATSTDQSLACKISNNRLLLEFYSGKQFISETTFDHRREYFNQNKSPDTSVLTVTPRKIRLSAIVLN